MQEHKKTMNVLNQLFNDLVVIGFSRNIVIDYADQIKKNNKNYNEKETEKQIEIWDADLLEVQNKFYEFCKKNKTEYYENKDGVEVFKVNGFYFSFTFGKDMLFSLDFSSFEKLFDSKIVEIDR